MGLFRLALAVAVCLVTTSALADEKCPTPPHAPIVTWGAPPAHTVDNAAPVEESTPVMKARDLLSRAKFLDEAATADEKASTELATRLPALRTAAKVARERADKATGADREHLVATAEDLETEVTVSEAEAADKRRAAVDNRRVARELRARAVKLVREGVVEEATSCDPPFRFTPDGRKIYRLECLK